MELKCYNQKCLHEWNYRGKVTDDKGNITCPKCLYKLKLGKAKAKKHGLGNLPTYLPNQLGNLPSQYKKEIKQPETDKVEKDYYGGAKKEMVRVDVGDGETALVEKKIAQQIRDAPDENDKGEAEPMIKVLDNSPKIIRVIPYDPIRHLDHQKRWGANIANVL